MVVALAVHHVVALVVAAGHKGHIAHVDGTVQHGIRRVYIRRAPRVFHAAGPLAAVRFYTNGAQVAAHAHQSAGQAAGLGSLAHHFHGVALAHAAHIQRHFRVGQINGLGIRVDDHVVDITVLGGCFQLFHSGQFVVGIRLGGFGSFAVIVPDIQHAAHGNVQLAVGGLVHLVGQLQHGEDAVVHLHRSAAGIVVDGLDVSHAGVIVVDIIQLIIGNKVCVQGIHLGIEFFLALAVGDHLRYGIEHIIKNGGIAGKLFLFGGTACQQAQAEHPGQ